MSELQNLEDVDHDYYMSIALNEAIIAGERGDKAIGAVLVHNDKVIDKSSNKWYTMNSRVHHAENTLVLNNAQYLTQYGAECILYTTAEPCLCVWELL